MSGLLMRRSTWEVLVGPWCGILNSKELSQRENRLEAIQTQYISLSNTPRGFSFPFWILLVE